MQKLLYGQLRHGPIPANKALAYNEALDYLLIQLNDDGNFKDKKIIVAEALLTSVIKDCGIKNYKKNQNIQRKRFQRYKM